VFSRWDESDGVRKFASDALEHCVIVLALIPRKQAMIPRLLSSGGILPKNPRHSLAGKRYRR
jgi:hypothetical protein